MKYDGKNAEELMKRGLLAEDYIVGLSFVSIIKVKEATLNCDILSLYIPCGIVEFYLYDSHLYMSRQVRLRVKEL